MEIVARVFIGILQNLFRSWDIIFFSKSEGRILDELHVSFKQREILWLEKLILISPARIVTICDMMRKLNSDLHIPEHIGRN